MKKFVSITLVAVLIVSCFAFAVNAQSTVSIRIEGKNSTYFRGDVPIGEKSTVLDIVKAVDEAEDSLNVTVVDSQYGAYISGINGDNEETITVPDEKDPEKSTSYYIGWMFAVNNQNASVGVSGYELTGGEDIVLYYADMGAQVPVFSFPQKGVISVKSYDFLPDWSGSDWLPVVDAKVTIGDKEYVTDETGTINYEPSELSGFLNIKIEKNDVLGYPLVARLAEDFGYNFSSETQPTETESDPASEATEPVVQKPVTFNYSKTLYVKGTYKISVVTDEKVNYTTSKKSVATVDGKGKITAKKAGTATIKATVGNVTANYKITVKNPTLNYSKKTLKKGKSFTLKVTGAIGKIKYSTNKKSVATVSTKGKVTAKKKGKAVISVKANGVTLKCKVTVK